VQGAAPHTIVFEGSGFRTAGVGFMTQGLGFRVLGLKTMGHDLGLAVKGFEALGSRVIIWGLGV